MKALKKSLAMMMILTLILSMVSCGKSDDELIGTWEGTFKGVPWTFTFENDGKGKLTMESKEASFTYEIKDDKVTLNLEKDNKKKELSCTYKVSGKKLTLSDNGDDQVFTKKE